MKLIVIFLLVPTLFLTTQTQTPDVSLDSFVETIVQKQNIAGASVLVIEKGKVLLNKGYGFADLSHGVKATGETTYFLVGPGGFILSACILQLVEQGKISLDDDVAKYLPDFPLQGHPVKVRHLITSTSGIIDYHYLGDPLESTYHTPKASDEVIALFKGRPFTSDTPGSRWDWSISNFALLVEILEAVSGASYKEYLQKHIIEPLDLHATTYLEERTIVKNFARGYGKQGDNFYPTYQSLFTYDPSLRIGISTGDIAKIWEGIRTKKLISQKSFDQMTTPEGAARQINQADPTLQFGFIIRIRKVGEELVMGLHGALPGYSSHCYYFPKRDLTVVVLANTSNQYANEIGQAIGLKLLGLPQPPERIQAKFEIFDLQISREEQKALSGTYVLSLAPDPARHRSYDYYRRTVRIFVEHGQLKFQRLGASPELLLEQGDGSFVLNSIPSERMTFEIKNGVATTITTTDSGRQVNICTRIGDGDAETFHKGGKK